jgi:hypothetical protein
MMNTILGGALPASEGLPEAATATAPATLVNSIVFICLVSTSGNRSWYFLSIALMIWLYYAYSLSFLIILYEIFP